MYNAEQKMEFITAAYPDEAKRVEITKLFESFTPHEESWGSDLIIQPINLLQSAFDDIVKSIAVTNARTLLTALRKYRKWYLDRNPKAVSAGVGLLKLNVGDKLRGSMVASPKHLRLVLDEVLDPPEMESMDCVFRVLLWLAFAGIPRDQAALVTVDEVDFNEMRIHHGGIDYEIHTEGLKEFRKLCELDSLVYIHRNPDYEQRLPRIEGNQLLRRTSVKSLEILKLCNDMRQRFVKTEWSLTYENVSYSGLYYEKYELERAGQTITFDDEIEKRLEERHDASKAILKSNRNSIRSRHRARYTQWKSLFHVAAE